MAPASNSTVVVRGNGVRFRIKTSNGAKPNINLMTGTKVTHLNVDKSTEVRFAA